MLTMIDKEGTPMRIPIWLLSAAAVLYGLAVAAFGTVHLITQGASRTTVLTVENGAVGFGDFTTVGEAGIGFSGTTDTATLSITNLPVALHLLHLSAGVCTVLVYLAMAVAAALLGRALLRGRPFSLGVTRTIEIAVVALLGFGLAAQVLDWAADVTILDYLGDLQFSRAFTFDPLVVAGALGLALVAVAFRAGTRMQRDTEGLV
jgi:hypothetical protein